VVDNYGDIGTCWRLAQQLADEYQVDVRLWVDNLDSFARLCPEVSVEAAEQRVGEVEIRRWTSEFPIVEVADVVLEAFACELPGTYLDAMTRRAVAPVWINLEYLSAETWVEGCHTLQSARSNSSLKKYFFFPGFTPRTGGLLRERNLRARRAAFNQPIVDDFWRSIGIPAATDDELRISLFCYDNNSLPELLQCWANGPTSVRVLAAPGAAADQVASWFGRAIMPGTHLVRGALAVHGLPFLPQTEYDRLLWCCDVNFVRGEDSFVRAQWAQRPFVWQIYPQTEGAHLVKLDAFLTLWLTGFAGSAVVRACWDAWNGAGDIGTAWQDYAAIRLSVLEHSKVWASELDQSVDLADNLWQFVLNL
jgi:uncharacterized repeat protein (TIGR03837 family)